MSSFWLNFDNFVLLDSWCLLINSINIAIVDFFQSGFIFICYFVIIRVSDDPPFRNNFQCCSLWFLGWTLIDSFLVTFFQLLVRVDAIGFPSQKEVLPQIKVNHHKGHMFEGWMFKESSLNGSER
jgi:hypothetical protein